MAERARKSDGKATFPRSRTFGTAAVTARQQFAWIWSRESLLRLGLSLVLATALWLYVTGKSDPLQAWDYPFPLTVTAQNVRDGLTITNNLSVVQVRVQADRNTTPVTQSSFHTFIDLSGYAKGLHYVKVNVLTDPGITVLQVVPSTVLVELAPVKAAEVPVHVRIYSKPPSGYSAQPAQVTPGTVSVTGPATTVSQVTQAIVYVSLSGATSSVTGSYQVALQDSHNNTVASRLLSAQPGQVRVTVPVAPLSSYKTLPVIASIRGQPRAGFGVAGVTVSPSNITAYGSPVRLSSISSVLTAPVSVSRRGAGTFTRRVRIHLPSGIHGSISQVTVSTAIQPVSGSSSIEVGVVPQNVLPGLRLSTSPATVLVTVVGPSTALRNAGRQMRAVIDLTGQGAGVYQLAPRVSVPKGLGVESVYPATVTVVLRQVQ